MKRTITGIVLIVSVIGLGISSLFITIDKCEKLQVLSNEIKESIKNNDMDLSKEKVNKLDEMWAKDEDMLRIFIRRENLDEISKQVSGLKGWMEIEDETESTAALSIIYDILDDISKSELPTFKNIL